MLHLKVDRRVQGGQDQAVVKVEAGGVHEVQQEGKAFRVHFWVQADGTKVCILGMHKHRVEESTEGGRNDNGYTSLM